MGKAASVGKRCGSRSTRVLGAALAIALSGCGTLHKLPADGRWYSLAAIQAVEPDGAEKTQRLDLRASVQPWDSACANVPKVDISVRVIEIKPFSDYTKLPESDPAPGTTPVRFTDSGPLDMSIVGAWRIVTIGTGYELLARAKSPCAAVRVRKLD